ncbi:signal recognition particle receptor beta subunit [Cercophora newfieldiana]|uniref:Signal recognition particle receptor subunit beta n=1 Tax=Cercophora newfieldiana TaxID=92897 RepID=A0AA40CP42_9PEZI|nr:signal recognition particle receptor beta subunit [Cercophora newfieldiana]
MALDLEGLKAFLTYILTPSAPVFIVGFAIVLLFPILLHFILHGGNPSFTNLPSVLLLGPSGSGKTAILTLFERGAQPSSEKNSTSPAPTHTSQAPGTVELAVSEDGSSSFRDDLDAAGATAKKFLLVDTPGHAKLRRHALSLLAPTASSESAQSKLRSVVFVVDAAALADGDALPTTAGYLYDALLSLQKRMGSGRGSKAPASIPVLIAANKLDLFTALPAALVKSNLEAELGRIRKTRSKGLLDSGVGTDDIAAEENDDWLGEYGSEKFTFKQLLEFDIEVDVIGGNTQGDGPGADKWWKWIAERI